MNSTYCLAFPDAEEADTEQIAKLNVQRTHKNENRPNMPSRWYIICTYSLGHLDFILQDGIEDLQITLGDEMFPVWEGYVNKANPTTEIPNLRGEIAITCEDNLGRKYYGTLFFNED